MLRRYPSGCHFATVFQVATPVVAEFSTTTAWPSRSLSLSASNRLTKSGLPPAGVPVTILSARAGHCCAAAGTASAAARITARRRGSIRMREVIGARARQSRGDRDSRCYHWEQRRGQVLDEDALLPDVSVTRWSAALVRRP